MRMIDAHIHLDHYKDEEITDMIGASPLIDALVSVSFDLESCQRNLQLARKYTKVKPAFGYHPEQSLPEDDAKNTLFQWMEEHLSEMIAIGEVGLPTFNRMAGKISDQEYQGHIELLEAFIQKAKKWEKPLALHAVYDEAQVACQILEKYTVKNAHFHWFKGDQRTIARMIENGYFISITPEVVYDGENHPLVAEYPLEQMMIETDGPWPFEGPFKGQLTHPNMMAESVQTIAQIKGIPVTEVSRILLQNTKSFYNI